MTQWWTNKSRYHPNFLHNCTHFHHRQPTQKRPLTSHFPLIPDGEETEIQFAESVLAPAADAYYKRHSINFNSPQDSLSLEEDSHLHFLIGLDSDASDVLRDLTGLEDVVPLLVAIDIPNRRFAVMEYGVEIALETVGDFVERFQRGELDFQRLADSAENS